MQPLRKRNEMKINPFKDGVSEYYSGAPDLNLTIGFSFFMDPGFVEFVNSQSI